MCLGVYEAMPKTPLRKKARIWSAGLVSFSIADRHPPAVATSLHATGPCGIGVAIGVGRLSVEDTARSPTSQRLVAGGREARDAPRRAGARVDGGLRAPARAAWSACAARVRRCVRIWSITDVCVMNATIRIAPWHVGHARGSTSKICWSSAAHRRLASVGASRGALGPSSRRLPRPAGRSPHHHLA